MYSIIARKREKREKVNVSVGNAARHARVFFLFHESTENVKDVSLTDMRMESIEGNGNGGSLYDAFLLFRDNAECFFLLLL